MIPKVASLPSLSAVRQVARTSTQTQSARQDERSLHGRRRSLDAGHSRPRSRNASSQDLVGLAEQSGSNGASSTPVPVGAESPITISRPISPVPSALWTVAESPACTPVGSYTDDFAFNKFPLPSKLPAASTTQQQPSKNAGSSEGDVMGAAVATEQQQPPAAPTPTSSPAALHASSADALDDLIMDAVAEDLALLTAACGDLDDVPVPTASKPFAAPPPLPPLPTTSPFTIAASLPSIAAPVPAKAATAPPPLQLPAAFSAPVAGGSTTAPSVKKAAATKALAAIQSSAAKELLDQQQEGRGAGGSMPRLASAPAASPASPPALRFPPADHEVHIYHAHANLTYIQELMGNLAHVHHMFKGAKGSGSGSAAAGAVAAARMLSRSLSRAAQRLRSACLGQHAAPPAAATTPGIRLVGGGAGGGAGGAGGSAAGPTAAQLAAAAEAAASRVVLAREAVHTLTEFGWAELVTCDAEQASLVGALDLEVHDLATGRVDAYHRQSPAHAWVHVGVSAGGTRAELVHAILGPTSPLGPLSRASSAGSSCCASPGAFAAPPPLPPSPSGALLAAAAAEGGVSVTVARFAQQLQEAGAAVLAAAQLLQQWIDDLRAASDAAAAHSNVPSSSASAGRTCAANAGTPQLVTAAVSA